MPSLLGLAGSPKVGLCEETSRRQRLGRDLTTRRTWRPYANGVSAEPKGHRPRMAHCIRSPEETHPRPGAKR